MNETSEEHRSMMIAGHAVGGQNACFVIAEAGVNHNGSPDMAHRLIDVAADAHADAVKFQTFNPGSVVSRDAAKAPYQRLDSEGDQLAMLRQLTLPRSIWGELKSHARDRGLVFLSTAFDLQSLELLLEVGIEAIKVPSGELTNVGLIGQFAACGLPMIVSTGMSTLQEVREAVHAGRPAPSLGLLHCVSAYPASPCGSNLRAIQTLQSAFDLPVGWSDHTRGSLTAIAAVTLGASIIEKHFTLDRSLTGPDHRASSDPAELAQLVSDIRATEQAIGDGVKRPTEEEEVNRLFVRRSYHARRALSPGHTIGDQDVELLRPAIGLPPSYEMIGRIVARPVPAGRALTRDDLQ